MVEIPLDVLGLYELLAGIGILGFWVWAWRDSGQRGFLFDRFHVTAEILTAAILFAAAYEVIMRLFLSVLLSEVGLAMLLYASINSSGQMLKVRRWVGLVMVAEAIVTALFILFTLSWSIFVFPGAQ